MSKKPSPSAMVRDLLARVGAPTAAPAGGGPAAEVEASEPAAPADTGAAALARENARAALRRAMGLPPMPVPTVGNGVRPTLVGLVTEALAPKPHRSAPAASVPVWRSDVARRVRVERAGGRCECWGLCGRGCVPGPKTGRCAVQHGDRIPGPRDYPSESRTAVLVAVTIDRAMSGRDPANMRILCPECAESAERRALQTTPAKAGKRGGVAARDEQETGMEFD